MSGATVVLVYDEPLDPSSTPPASAYDTTGASPDTWVTGVEIAGRTVRLTQNRALSASEGVAVTYDLGATRLKDFAGNAAAAILLRDAVQPTNVTGDTEAPALTRAAVNGTALTLSYDAKLDRTSVPAAGAFAVTVDGSAVDLAASNPVSVGATAVTLTLAQAVAAGAWVTLDYAVPSVNPIQDFAGNDAAALTGQFVGNPAAGDARAPVFQSAFVDGTKAVLTYDEALDPGSTPAAAAFKWTVNGGADNGVNSVEVAERTVTLTLALAATAGQAIAVKYAKPTGANAKPLQDYAGNAAAGFSGGVAAVNIAGDTAAPVLAHAAVDGAALTLTYNEALDGDPFSVPAASAFTVKVNGDEVALAATGAVSVGGRSVTLTLAEAVSTGDAATVAYAVPSVNPIQDLAGNDAGTLSGQFVANVTRDRTAVPEVRSVTLEGTTLTLVYSEVLDPASAPAGDRFTIVNSGTGTIWSTGTGAASIDGAVVTVTMNLAVTAASPVMKYRKPTGAGAKPLQDLDGNAAADLSVALGSKRIVRISSVAITSTPAVDSDENGVAESYGRGDAVEVTVTWGDYVTWDVSAASNADIVVRLKVPKAGGGTNIRTAKLVRAGDAKRGRARALVFRYAVQSADVEPATPTGIEVLGGTLVKLTHGATLEAQNATVRVTATALPADLGHQVRGGVAPAPKVTRAVTDGTVLTLSYSKELDRTSVPAPGAFTVRVDGSPVPLAASGAVEVGEKAVTLRLAGLLTGGERVTVDYTKPSEDPIQDLAGNAAAAFSGRWVANAASGDTRAPVRLGGLSVPLNGTTAVLTYDEALDPASTPPGSQFRVVAIRTGGGNQSIAVTARGHRRRAGDADAGAGAAAGDTAIRLDYLKLSNANRLQDHAGNEADAFYIITLQNVAGDTTAPALQTATVDGSALTLTYGEALDPGSVPAASAFTVKADGSVVPLAASNPVTVAETAVTLTLADVPDGGGRVTVDYAVPSDNPIQDLAGNDAAAFSGQFAGHATAADESGAPVLRHATVDGTTLKLVFNKALDPGSAPAGTSFRVVQRTGTIGSADLSTGTGTAGIDGAVVTVTLGTSVTRAHNVILVRYDRPDENPLMDYSGNAAGDQFVDSNNIRIETGLMSAPGIIADTDDEKGVEITSRPTVDAVTGDNSNEAQTYAEGDRIDVTVTWNRYVTWDSANMRVQLNIGGSTRNAMLVTRGADSGTAKSLVFRYVVQSGDTDVNGIAVQGGPVVRLGPGATLTGLAGSPPRAASRTHPGLPETENNKHQVRWAARTESDTPPDTTPPRLVAGKMEFLGPDPKTGGTRFTLQFSEPLHPDSNDVKPYLNFRYVDESGGLPPVDVVGSTLVMHDKRVWIDGSMGNAWVEIGDTSHIRDLAGNPMAPLEGRFPLVNTSTDSPGSPRLASAAVRGNAVTLRFDQTLDQAEVPGTGAFGVSGGAAAPSVSRVAVAGSVVTLTLGRAVGAEDGDIRVRYSRPDARPLCNLWGSEVAGFARVIARDARAPKLAQGTIDGSTAKLLYDEPLDATVAPSTGQFTLTANDGTVDRALAVSGVRIAGATVTLTLAGAATAAETVTVAFADATGIRDLAGNRAAAQGDAFTLTNTAASSPGAPELVADGMDPVVVAGKRLTLTFTQKLDPTLVPAAPAFSVWTEPSPGAPRTEIPVDAAAVGGKTVVLTLRRAIRPGPEEYKVTYAEPPAGHPRLRDLWLQAVAGFEKAVSVPEADTLAPRLAKAEVAGDKLKLTFDEALDAASLPPSSAFSVRASAPDDTVTTLRGKADVDATVADKVVTVTLSKAPREHELLSVTYTRADAGDKALRDAAGNRVASIRQGRANNLDVYPPKFLDGTVNGSVVKLHFSEPLDERTPAPTAGKFEFEIVHAITSVTFDPGTVTVTRVKGATIEISIANAPDGNHTASVRITSTNNIRDLAGNGMTSPWRKLTNIKRAAFAPYPAPESIKVDGAYLTIRYNLKMDAGTVPALEAFDLASFTAAVNGVAIGGTGDQTGGNRSRLVILALNAPVPPCEEYEMPSGDDPGNLVLTYDKTKATIADTFGPIRGPLQSPRGVEADGFTNREVTNARADRCVHGVPTGEGERTEVKLNFYRSLATRNAPPATAFSLSGESGASAPAVSAASFSADGTGVRLTLDRALAPGETATVSYARPKAGGGLWDSAGKELASFSGVVVKGADALAGPAVTAVRVVPNADEDETYGSGEAIRVALTFSEAVAVTGAPRLTIDLDPAQGGARAAAYEGGTGTAVLTFAYTVAEPDLSTAGVAVTANTLELNGGTLRSAASGADADLAHEGLDHDPAHKVDWRPPPPPPASVIGVAVVSDAGDDRTYGPGDVFRVRLTFDEAVTVTGAPTLAIDMDPDYWGTKRALYEDGSGTAALTFAYTVEWPNESTRGIAVLANTLETAGASIRSTATGADADLAHAGLGHDAAHKVDWRLLTQAAAASVIAVAVVSDPGADDTYGLGDTIRVQVTFDEAVAVTGAPLLRIDMDPAHWGTKEARYEGGSGTASLTFVHQVVEPNVSTRGIAVLANALETGGGTIRSVATGTDAHLSHAGLDHDPAHKVDWRWGWASVTGVAVVSDAGADDTYRLGDVIRVRVDFSEAVAVSGAPRLKIDMDPAHWGTKEARYEGGGGTAALTFTHTVVEPNLSTRGIAVLADSLSPNGGAIRTAATQGRVRLSHAGLGHDPAHKVDWRPGLSVADAEAHEGEDATLDFVVSLDAASSARVTVDYATADGTATAGEDYTATSGTLTFAAGERRKTVGVPLLDDAVDEGRETFTLRLSNPQGAWLQDAEATGTIVNSDRMPKAWTARFGRTVAVHVVDAVQQRLEDAPSESWAQVGGRRLGSPPPDVAESASRLAPSRSLWQEAEAAHTPGDDMTPRQLLLDSAFHLVSNHADQATGPRLSAWGRVASSVFDGKEDRLSLDGTVTTATLGVDGIWDRWLTGLLLAYSEGDGSFTHLDLPGGDVSSSLTSVHPYVAWTLSDRVRLWGLVGYGSGALRLELEDERAMDTDLTLTMGALGVRGDLLQPSRGLQLALRSDVLWMVMDSARADNMAATEAEASRLRLVLEGSRPVALAGGGSFTPSLEVGLRHDDGDAETGTGVEVGGSLRYASAWGLSIEASLRGLVAHEAQDYTEWGASAALRFDPGRQGRGFTASVAPTWGAAASGMSRLWDQSTTAGLVPADPLGAPASTRLEAELGYGLAALRGRGLLTPYARVALTEGADQAWHLGTRLALAETLNFSLEASRRAREGAVAAHELALRANLGF